MSKGANTFHESLCEALEDYIRAQYLGRSPVLLKALGDRLHKEGVLWRRPYVEATPAYVSTRGGLRGTKLPDWLKDFFDDLAEKKLGVFSSPFNHQIRALDAAWEGRDLFVSTGTGSGKTECFMWPMLAKLANEAKERPESWRQRGVRVLVMYPMNALVSDQLSRLRRMIGYDPQDANLFPTAFRAACGADARRPQFGMYTGRTSYPGEKNTKASDEQLAKVLYTLLHPSKAKGDTDPAQIGDSEDDLRFVTKLKQEGRLPAKKDLEQFINGLREGVHYTDPEDAELLTRFEMQRTCPDILITNYSMLEYMLFRPQEAKIWSETAARLRDYPDEKLLFIIDEAHMYRGAAGGEVALLLRRLAEKLGVDRSRFQFILTTASMPNSSEADRQAVRTFARELTSATEDGSFVFLTGEQEEISDDATFDLPLEHFDAADPEALESGGGQLGALCEFWRDAPGAPTEFESLEALQAWMYDNLLQYRPFCRMIKDCRSNAVSLEELAEHIFPAPKDKPSSDHKERALHAVSVMLAIAPLAKNGEGATLFPVRMHMLFRGLSGVYACVNENCPHAQEGDGITLGEIILSDSELTCPCCGSVVYELYNDRRCGALYLKGYVHRNEINTINTSETDTIYLWRRPGNITDDAELQEIHLFIPSAKREVKRPTHTDYPVKECYLDIKSGYLWTKDDSKSGDPNYRKLYMSSYVNNDNAISFSTCMHCRKRMTLARLTPFSTRGSQAFFNLIHRQFCLQPPAPDKAGKIDEFPNEGRKVLLFSDSRQRAAKLARDMSEIADVIAGRQLFAVAVRLLGEADNRELTLDDLYGYVCLSAVRNEVPPPLFANNERAKFKKDCNRIRSDINRPLRRRRQSNSGQFNPHLTTSESGRDYKKLLLRLFAGSFTNLIETGSCWLKPSEKGLDKIYEILIERANRENLNDEDLIFIINNVFDSHEFCRRMEREGLQITGDAHDKIVSARNELSKEADRANPSERVREMIREAMSDDVLAAIGNACEMQVENYASEKERNLIEKLRKASGRIVQARETAETLKRAAEDEELICELFNAWLMSISDNNLAIGHTIDDETREHVRTSYGAGYGIDDSWDFPVVVREIMGWSRTENTQEKEAWKAAFSDLLCEGQTQSNGDKKYLRLEMLVPRFDPDHPWQRCPRCKTVTPYALRGRCPGCGSDEIEELSDLDKKALEFWNKPIDNAINGKRIFVIDTEEHTAQLSQKDERDSHWSLTERYELLFQDFPLDQESPVDILSCTTTMEVGVDIGSLVAVGLRNIPPTRENYQQRAGRAGRRGSSLSTIVTFCEGGPHDVVYFKNPAPMFRGDPRRPKIDVESRKLWLRHISMLAIRRFMGMKGKNIDKYWSGDFLQIDLPMFKKFLLQYEPPVDDQKLLKQKGYGIGELKKDLEIALDALHAKFRSHPELYGPHLAEDGKQIQGDKKSILDALYEEGIIPGYSFPKNVVSVYLKHKRENRNTVTLTIPRSIDIALSEYAPGRSITVDKQEYQIGGLTSGFRYHKDKSPRDYLNDPSWCKPIFRCGSCQWFGIEKPKNDVCPHCGKRVVKSRPMLRPWGFGPTNGKPVIKNELDEKYTWAQTPYYSTVPDDSGMIPLPGFQNVAVALRDNSRIIMMNRGTGNKGFYICEKCGAAIPVPKKEDMPAPADKDKTDQTNKSVFPDKWGTPNDSYHCKHFTHVVDLGYDFVTDMLVLAFRLPPNSRSIFAEAETWSWLARAGQALAEALRLAICTRLDIDFTELVTGYRPRLYSSSPAIDVFVYDNLTSGAGYSISVRDEIGEILASAEEILDGCTCDSACFNCLKHFRNHFVHDRMDRHAALALLRYGRDGSLPGEIDVEIQKKYLAPLESILKTKDVILEIRDDGAYVSGRRVRVVSALGSRTAQPVEVTVREELLKFSRPDAVEEIITQASGNSPAEGLTGPHGQRTFF